MIDHFSISSPNFENHGLIPERFTCEGSDINPELHIHNVPPSTKSMVLIMDDPDAPDGTFVHWTVWNIDPETKIIKPKHLPEGAIEGLTSFNKKGYGGPCPPPGKPHRYYFKLYALGRKIDLPESSRVEDLEREIHSHLVGKADMFLGRYKRESILY